jgi:hypothetical protein
MWHILFILLDHESESGVGFGYTDEGILRLDLAAALDMMEKNLAIAERAIV